MRFPITISPDATLQTAKDGPFVLVDGETMMIELQGSLETEANAPLQDGQSLGRLDLSNPSKPTLRISHALLTGSIVTLQKPLAVLRHTLQQAQPSQSDPGSDSEPDSDSEQAPAKRVKLNTTTDASSSPQDTFKKASARNFAPKTPLSKFKNKSEGGAVESSSPLAPSPATPASVSELRSGSHEVVGIIRRKIVFSQRPMPVVT